MKADLHLHTTASDGKMTPTEVVSWAKKAGLEVMAITDHDTTKGLDEGKEAAKKAGIEFIPGIEVSTFSICEIHILGYNIDYENEGFQEKISWLQNQRKERNIKIGENLKKLGINLDMDFEAEGLGRMVMAREMVKEGVCQDIQEVFDKYLGTTGKAYCAVRRMMPMDAVKLITEYGGTASIAHPKKYLLDKRLEILISGLRSYGLGGIETYYPGHTEQDVKQLLSMCDRYRLIPTGGSDFHGDEDKDFIIDLDSRTEKKLLKTRR